MHISPLNDSYLRRAKNITAHKGISAGFHKQPWAPGYTATSPEGVSAHLDFSHRIKQKNVGWTRIGNYQSLVPDVPVNLRVESSQNQMFLTLGMGSLLVAAFLKSLSFLKVFF